MTAMTGFSPVSVGGYRNFEIGGDIAWVIRIAYQVDEAYPGFGRIKVR